MVHVHRGDARVRMARGRPGPGLPGREHRLLRAPLRAHLDGHRLRLQCRAPAWLGGLAELPARDCARWHRANLVLLGDAAATAHFSVGSGTRLAMESAISLSDACTARGRSTKDSRATRYYRETVRCPGKIDLIMKVFFTKQISLE